MIEPTIRILPADVYDTLEFTGIEYGVGMTAYSDYEPVVTEMGYEGFSRQTIVAPRCLIGHARFVENGFAGTVEAVLRRHGVDTVWNDGLVREELEIVRARVLGANEVDDDSQLAIDDRISWARYAARAGFLRAENL